jgi:hypothetical protein
MTATRGRSVLGLVTRQSLAGGAPGSRGVRSLKQQNADPPGGDGEAGRTHRGEVGDRFQ